MDLQKILNADVYQLLPLQDSDFDRLYAIANDKLLWAQHPNPNRYLLPDFTNYFKGAIASKGAYIIINKDTNEVLGCTRYYDATDNSIFVGYTFIARKYWGTAVNATIKKILLNYIFQFVVEVKFHVGIQNIRSQKAMEKLGAIKNGEVLVVYYGEESRPNIEYIIHKKQWVLPQLSTTI